MPYDIRKYMLFIDKYIDPTTKRLLKFWRQSKSTGERKDLYKSLQCNVGDINKYLRKKLGYLDPSVDMMYKTAEPNVKRGLKMWIIFCFMISSVDFAIMCEKNSMRYNTIMYYFFAVNIFISNIRIYCEKYFIQNKKIKSHICNPSPSIL